jgi:hypothetical protein
MSICLLVKTHSKTGLKYLCKTTRKDYNKYKGSGLYWKDHLKIHGYEHQTELLKECYTNEEVREWGRYYSDLWNVVEAKDKNGKKLWANLVPEEGQGISGDIGKIIQNRPEVKAKNIAGVKEFYKNNPQVREQHRQKALLDNPMNKVGIKEKHKKLMSTFQGENNKSTDLRIHKFRHKSGLEEVSTQNELKKKYNLKKSGISQLVNGHKNFAYGWMVI